MSRDGLLGSGPTAVDWFGLDRVLQMLVEPSDNRLSLTLELVVTVSLPAEPEVLRIRFEGVRKLKIPEICNGYGLDFSEIEVEDLSVDQLEDLNYRVIDRSSCLSFYCRAIEARSAGRSDLDRLNDGSF